VARFAGTVPGVLFDVIQKAEAMGIDLRGLLAKAGIETGGAEGQTRTAAASPGGEAPKS
jgi:hypothetical protein